MLRTGSTTRRKFHLSDDSVQRRMVTLIIHKQTFRNTMLHHWFLQLQTPVLHDLRKGIQSRHTNEYLPELRSGDDRACMVICFSSPARPSSSPTSIVGHAIFLPPLNTHSSPFSPVIPTLLLLPFLHHPFLLLALSSPDLPYTMYRPVSDRALLHYPTSLFSMLPFSLSSLLYLPGSIAAIQK